MLTEQQQALWLQREQEILTGVERHLASLIKSCDTIANPLIEKAIGGLDNAGVGVVTYHMALAEARMQLKLLAEHRERFSAAMARVSNSPSSKTE